MTATGRQSGGGGRDRRAGAQRVTSHDVARMAGVSQPTVSRALRGRAGVSEETRQRVLDAAAALYYVTSEVGRSLSTRATLQVGVVVSELTNPFYPYLVEPLHDELDRAGYRMVLFTEAEDDIAALRRLLDRSIDGVVLTTSTHGSALPFELVRRSIPFVFLNREVEGVDADAAVVDNRMGGQLIAEELIRLGHRNISAIFGPELTSTGRERERGFREVLSEHGLPLPTSRVRYGPFAFDAGRSSMLHLLDHSPEQTAVFCANDVIAMGAYNAAAARRVRVPEDLTIVGFDDIPMASWDVFRLTTVGYDRVGMAQAASRMLLERVAHPQRPTQRLVVPPELALRGTHSAIGAGTGSRGLSDTRDGEGHARLFPLQHDSAPARERRR